MLQEIEALSTDDQERLRGFADRIDAVQRQIDEFNSTKAKIYAEVRSAGFDAKIVKRVVAERGQDPAEYTRNLGLYAVYSQALGLIPASQTVASLVHAREANDAKGHPASSDLNPWPKSPDPRCLQPELCGGYSAKALCDTCKRNEDKQPDSTLNSAKES